MGNLGWYQVMTTVAKKVGGPRNLLLLTLGVGGALYAIGEAGVKRIKGKKSDRYEKAETAKTYNVTADGKGGKGLILNMGDSYRILESDGESILIEKIGDSDNPYFVSADFLRAVSDYV